MSQPLPVAVIGCGGIFRGAYLPVLRAFGEILQVRAVCDLNGASAEQAAASLPGASAWTDARAMLKAEPVRAVLVLTHERATAATAELALEFNLPAYIEKPPALNLAELEQLMAAEARSRTFVYTAYNRRHTPLFAGHDFSTPSLRRVTGTLARAGRIPREFPNTAVHLIDATQFFARSRFRDWKISYATQPAARWTIEGRLENGAEVTLQLLPDVPEFIEIIELAADDHAWTLRFPNQSATPPQGEIVEQAGTAAPVVTQPAPVTDFPEATGFGPCLRDFAVQVQSPPSSSPHRLAQSRATVQIMHEMTALVR